MAKFIWRAKALEGNARRGWRSRTFSARRAQGLSRVAGPAQKSREAGRSPPLGTAYSECFDYQVPELGQPPLPSMSHVRVLTPVSALVIVNV